MIVNCVPTNFNRQKQQQGLKPKCFFVRLNAA